MIFIVVFLLLLSSVLYLFNKAKRDDDAPFWRKLVRAISLKVMDYYCAGTPTKIVSIFLRGLFSMYSIAAFSYPTIKAIRLATDSKSFWSILISWDGVSTKMTCLFVLAATVVVLVYLILHRHEMKEASEESVRNIIKNWKPDSDRQGSKNNLKAMFNYKSNVTQINIEHKDNDKE